MENVKYILIVSQYYYSHHCFVVSAAEENFREKALTLIEKLEDYKRDKGEPREYNYGNEREKAYRCIDSRWNVNDFGDIYFIPCQSMLGVMKHTSEYNSTIKFEHNFRGVPKKQRDKMETAIFLHHSFDKVKDIVGSVFNIL